MMHAVSVHPRMREEHGVVPLEMLHIAASSHTRGEHGHRIRARTVRASGSRS
jgi:hypothetical protein